MIDKFSQNMEFWKNAIDIRAKRQEVLASNIANADTPYYKARDVDFAGSLQAALQKRKEPIEGGQMQLNKSNERHIDGMPGDPTLKLLYHNEYQSAVDENTVEMDVERSKFIDNSLQYQILTQFTADEFKGIKEALASTQK